MENLDHKVLLDLQDHVACLEAQALVVFVAHLVLEVLLEDREIQVSQAILVVLDLVDYQVDQDPKDLQELLDQEVYPEVEVNLDQVVHQVLKEILDNLVLLDPVDFVDCQVAQVHKDSLVRLAYLDLGVYQVVQVHKVSLDNLELEDSMVLLDHQD